MGKSFPALLDLGSDDNLVPNTLIQALEDAGMFVPSRTLDTPVSFALAIKGTTATITRQVQLTVELRLPTGTLRLRNVCCLVAEHDMDDVLIGRPLLNSLGIDAPTHLAAVRETFQDMDCSTVPSALAGGKLSRLLKQRADCSLDPPVGDSPAALSDEGPHAPSRPDSPQRSDSASAETHFPQVFHGDTDVDPVEAPHMLTLPSSDEHAEIRTQKERMISEAVYILCVADKYCMPVKINMPLIINQPFLNISPLGIISR
jgi:Aspartyl protease